MDQNKVNASPDTYKKEESNSPHGFDSTCNWKDVN